MKTLLARVMFFLFTCIVSILVYSNTSNLPGYQYVFFIPLLYGFLMLVTSFSKYIYSNVGLFLFNIVAFIRYIILIYLGALAGFPINRGIVPPSYYIEHSILLMIFEMLISFLTIQILSSRYYAISEHKQLNTVINYKNSNFLKIFIFIAFLIVILYPDLLSKYNLVFNLEDYSEQISTNNGSIHGIFSLIIVFARTLLLVMLINFGKEKYDKTGKIRYVIFSTVVIIVNLLIVTELSRFSILISSISGLYFLNRMFQKQRKIISLVVGISILLSILVVSYYKLIAGSTSNDLARWSETLQAYFSGPKNVAISLIMAENFHINPIVQIFKDNFSSVAGIAGMINQNSNIISYFNFTYYGSYVSRDQIVPLLGQGNFYFGYLGSIIPTVLSTWTMMWLDKKTRIDKNPYKIYVSYFMAAWFGSAMMINWPILFSHFVNTFLFMMIIIQVNNLLKVKPKSNMDKIRRNL